MKIILWALLAMNIVYGIFMVFYGTVVNTASNNEWYSLANFAAAAFIGWCISTVRD